MHTFKRIKIIQTQTLVQINKKKLNKWFPKPDWTEQSRDSVFNYVHAVEL